MDQLLGFFSALPTWGLYLVLAAGATAENLFPPIPADTAVALGGFLAGRGLIDPIVVFLVTWSANVTGSLLVYATGRRYGRTFFEVGMGRYVLHGGQLEQVRSFYARWGVWAIFLTRFLPGLRAVVPVFAGVSRQAFLPVALPLLVASAIWYGGLVWLGLQAGRNVGLVIGWVSDINRGLLVGALLIGGAIALWWWRSRERRPEVGDDG